MSDYVRISVSATPWRLVELERLCAVARERGLTDQASLSYGPTNSAAVTVWDTDAPEDDE